MVKKKGSQNADNGTALDQQMPSVFFADPFASQPYSAGAT